MKICTSKYFSIFRTMRVDEKTMNSRSLACMGPLGSEISWCIYYLLFDIRWKLTRKQTSICVLIGGFYSQLALSGTRRITKKISLNASTFAIQRSSQACWAVSTLEYLPFCLAEHLAMCYRNFQPIRMLLTLGWTRILMYPTYICI